MTGIRSFMQASALPGVIAVLSLLLIGPKVTLAVDPDEGAFLQAWSRTDRPVQEGRADRTWIWGPDAFTGAMTEPYNEAPGSQRTVQYFDKSRMEDNSYRATDPWAVTNGLLVVEMMTGQMQVGDDTFQRKQPAEINVGGDADDTTGPTYVTLAAVRSAAPLSDGQVVGWAIDNNSNVTDAPDQVVSLGVTAGAYASETNHRVASVFWTFMNSSGLVWQNGQLSTDQLFLNPYYATGYPVTEAYWANIRVAGSSDWVLLQCFERRCLTYTPDNPEGWQVEAGNVGRHYYQWRHQDTNGDGEHVDQTPTLNIPSLKDGGTLALPAVLSYEIGGYEGPLAEGVHLQVTIDDPQTGYSIEIPLSGTSGEFLLPDDKMLTGQRDLTFQIVDGQHVPFMNPGARLTIHDLLITGGRSMAST